MAQLPKGDLVRKVRRQVEAIHGSCASIL